MSSLPSLQTNTIVKLPAELTAAPGTCQLITEDREHAVAEAQHELKIRLLNQQNLLAPVNMLIHQRYAWRGYQTNGIKQTQHLITLQATQAEHTVGTISIRFDSAQGLQLDQLFKTEIDQMRQAGRQLCEFTKLAISGDNQSRQLTGALFHLACICAYRINSCTDICIEVNPRHVSFYKRMLDFHQLSEARNNPAIQAPSVLMAIDLAHCFSLIEQFAGKPELAGKLRSFYPYFFAPEQEHELTQRLHSLLLQQDYLV